MKNLLFFVAGLILALFLRPCNPGQSYLGGQDTVFIHVKDTVYSQPKISFIEGGHIPSKVDTVTVIKTFYEKVFYSDTVRTPYGAIRIYDTVTQNRLSYRTTFTDFKIPVVPKQRNQVYIGLNGSYGQSVPMAVGASIMLKTKRDAVFEVGAMINTKSQVSYQAGMKFKIKIK